METRLYIGNLPFSARESDLRELFSQAGEVTDVVIIKDRRSNRSKGFGFVTMSNESETQAAIQMFNDHELEGRALKVSVARPKADRDDRRGGGNRDRRRDQGRRERRDSWRGREE